MKKATKTIASALLICLLATGCSSPKKNDVCDDLKLETVYNGKEISFLSDAAEEYLSATTEENQAKALIENVGEYGDRQSLNIRWERDGGKKYTVLLADNEKFENVAKYETTRRSVNVGGTLLPQKTYYYKVVGENKSSQTDKFVIKKPLRPINVDGAYNVRDLGGCAALNGKEVKYGLLYRGGRLNKEGNEPAITEEGKFVMKETLGIKTELDLRFTDVDDGGQTKSVIGDTVKYVKAPCSQYALVLPSFKGYGVNKRRYVNGSAEAIKRIFGVLADESNYPVYFHCNAGADRTGTIACLIQVVLGVNEEDMIKDFELTSFSVYGARYRGKIENFKFVNGVMQDNNDNFVALGLFFSETVRLYGTEGDSFGAAAIKYLKTACGVTDEEIGNVRKILLG